MKYELSVLDVYVLSVLDIYELSVLDEVCTI
jgi:hypothetical protein